MLPPDEDAPTDSGRPLDPPVPSHPPGAPAPRLPRRRPPAPSMPALGAPDDDASDTLIAVPPGVAAPVQAEVAAPIVAPPPPAPVQAEVAPPIVAPPPPAPVQAEVAPPIVSPLPPAPVQAEITPPKAAPPSTPVQTEIAPDPVQTDAPPARPDQNGTEPALAVPPSNGVDEVETPDRIAAPSAAILAGPSPAATLPVRASTLPVRHRHAAPVKEAPTERTVAPLPVEEATGAPVAAVPAAVPVATAPPARPAFALPTLPTTGVAGLAVWAVRLLLVAGALALGWAGQNMLDTARITNSGAPPANVLPLWALGAVLLAIGAWPAPLIQTAVPAAARTLWGTNPRRRLAAGLGIAAGICALAGLPFFSQINDAPPDNPVVGLAANGAWGLYLLSLLLFGLAIIVWESGARGGSPAISADPLPDQLPRLIEVGVLIGLFALGLLFRVGNLDNAPPGLWFDEAQNGIVARSIVGLDVGHPVFIVARTQMGALYFYGLGMALALTGTKIATLRILPAVAGALMAPLLYLLGSRLYGWRAGLAAGGLITVAIWSITFSRFGIVTPVSVLFDLATLTFLVLGLRSGRLGWYALAGIIFGLNLHMYYVARLMPLVIALVFFHKLVSERGRFLRGIRFGLPAFAVGGILAFLPMALFALQHTADYMGRISDVSVFNPDANGGDPLAFQHSLEKHLWMFNWVGDGNARHNLPGAPMLDSIIGALFVLGVGYCLLRVVRWQFFFPLAWFSVELLGGVLSLPFEAPQANRTAENMVTTVLFAGLVLGLGAEALFRSRQGRPTPEPADEGRTVPSAPPPAVLRPVPVGRSRLLVRAGQVLAAILILAVVARVGQTASARYFVDQVNNSGTWREMYVPEMRVAQIMQQYGSNYDIYIVPIYNGLPPQLFLAANSPAPLEYPGEWAIPMAEPVNRNIAFVIDPPTAGDFARLTRLYPDATFNILRAPGSPEPLQYTAFITKEDLQAIHGVHARFFAADAAPGAAPLSERDLPSINQVWGSAPDDPKPPFRVRYEATLRIPTSTSYSLQLDGNPGGSQVQVDGFPAATPRLLGAGLHTLTVETTVTTANTPTRLMIAQEGGPGIEVPASMLFKPKVAPHGLTGSYRKGDTFDGEAAKVRVDPVLSFYFHEVPLERPYTVEWKGKLFIPVDGSYALGLEQISRSSLQIDGNEVINNTNDNSYQQNQLQLTRGLHDIRVRFEDLANYSHLYLTWTPPGHDRSIIPSYFLWPEMASYPDPNAGGDWPTLDDADGRVLPPGFEKPDSTIPAPVQSGQPPPSQQANPVPPAAQPPAGSATEAPPSGEAPPPAALKVPQATAVKATVQLALGGTADPRGMAADSAGNIYVVTGAEGKVHKYSPTGQEIASWGLVGKDGKAPVEPFSIAVEGEQVLVLDAATSGLLRYDLTGKADTPIHACECFFPRGMMVEQDGTLLIADTGGGRLVHINTLGQPLGTLGTRGSGPGQFVEPTSTWRAADGTLYVADVGNSRVQHLSADGQFKAEWPIGQSIARDGSRLTGDSAGHIYVSVPQAAAVVVYDAAGNALATWQNEMAAPLPPSGLLVSGKTLLVAYPANLQVRGFPTLP